MYRLWKDIRCYKESGLIVDFLRPKNINEAIEAKAKHPDYTILAGGTDTCVLINSDIIKPKGIISISNIPEIRSIDEDNDAIKIGALVTHTEIANNKLTKKYIPALVEACKTIGARQIQNRGTLGGNVMNASPAGDTLPVLLAYNTMVVAISKNGTRFIDFNNFYTGYRETALKKDEIVSAIIIKKQTKNECSKFIKIGTRKAQAISKVMGCFRVDIEKDEIKGIRISFGSVAPVPIRAIKTEKFLKGKKISSNLAGDVCKELSKDVSPIDDIRSTAEYRKYICGVLLKRFLGEII